MVAGFLRVFFFLLHLLLFLDGLWLLLPAFPNLVLGAVDLQG